jgi:hypothetical protein
MLERPKNIAFEAMRGAKKDITGVENVNVLVGENQISYLRSNESGNDFTIDSLYDYGLPMFGDYFLEYILFQYNFEYISILTLCQLIVNGSAKQHEAQFS